MEVVVLADPAAVAAAAADAVAELLGRHPAPVLGLATGSSPVLTYAELARRYRAAELSFGAARAFLLDEYVGLPLDHPQRYRAVIERELTGLVDFPPPAVHGPDPDPGGTDAGGSAEPGAGLVEACERYEREIRAAGGIDLQLLGIGGDGHLAFNEPGSSLRSRTRLKTLTAQTRQDNARFFGSLQEVPRHVLTQGLGTICEARHLVLIATGAGKADAVAGMVEGPLTASCPASVLQWHPHATVVLDEAAASRLTKLSYYREVYAAKPAWQRW